MSYDRRPLFSRHNLRHELDSKQKVLREALDALGSEALLNDTPETYFSKVAGKWILTCPALGTEIYADEPTNIKAVRPDWMGVPIDFPGQDRRVDATRVVYHVPVTGDLWLLEATPSQYAPNPPIAEIQAGELLIDFIVHEGALVDLPKQLNAQLQEINQWLSWIAADLAECNAATERLIKERFQVRHEKALKDQQMAGSLGVPIRRRTDAPATYKVPEVQRKATPVPAARADRDVGGLSDPTLEMAEYKHILSVMSNMAKVMERSPHAFVSINEEDLRIHFLVQLNGHYEGQATGETFNLGGKTDILIRYKDHNVFVGECKYWGGAKKLHETIDQLLDYVQWRDTKTAIIMFNRNKDFTGVVKTIKDEVPNHANYIGKVKDIDETAVCYQFSSKHDATRAFYLTVMAFDIPS